MKKNYLLLPLLLLPLIFNGCSCDVLAEYKDGRITRGEFKEWLSARHIPEDAVLDSVDNQKAKLRDIAVERLTLLEAKKAGFDKTDDFTKIEAFYREAFIADFYKKQLRSGENFEEDAVGVSVIKLRVKDYVTENNKNRKLTALELESEYQKQEKKAGELISALNSGGDFAALAKENSDDYSKEKGGDIGFVVKGGAEEDLVKAAFALNAGEFTQKPLRLRGAVCIVKANKKARLNNSNIESLVVDEKRAKQLSEMLRNSSADKYEQSLVSAGDVVNNIESANFRDKNTVVYSIGGKELTAGYLDELLSFLTSRLGGQSNEADKITNDQKKEIARIMFMRTLLLRDALKNNADKSKDYIKEWDFFYNVTLGTAYKNNTVLQGIKITPEQVNAEYAEQAKRTAERNKNLRPGMRPEPLRPFAEMKDRIENMLYGKERALRIRQYDDSLLESVNFAIKEDKLEVKKNNPKPPKP
ncbi:MAG: peptidylprolyl isomerase [Spirochaetia bacterium]|jgi:parvulin-like peptidyl-prolyl isomerase|nr:peptidylprolyl isomerase [Spirochaetia bacterium]